MIKKYRFTFLFVFLSILIPVLIALIANNFFSRWHLLAILLDLILVFTLGQKIELKVGKKVVLIGVTVFSVLLPFLFFLLVIVGCGILIPSCY